MFPRRSPKKDDTGKRRHENSRSSNKEDENTNMKKVDTLMVLRDRSEKELLNDKIKRKETIEYKVQNITAALKVKSLQSGSQTSFGSRDNSTPSPGSAMKSFQFQTENPNVIRPSALDDVHELHKENSDGQSSGPEEIEGEKRD